MRRLMAFRRLVRNHNRNIRLQCYQEGATLAPPPSRPTRGPPAGGGAAPSIPDARTGKGENPRRPVNQYAPLIR
jgi:hypothetical protein